MSSARYDVSRKLGQGAMGKVYLATDRETGRRVALKVINPQLLDMPEIFKRFEREAKVQSMIDHPGVVKILEAKLEGDQPYLAMELVEGHDLAEVIEEHAPLSVEQVIRIAADVAGALDLLHEQGVVHRDLKPANLMIRKGGGAVVMDLGLVALRNATQITRTGQILGTPLYLPPEILHGRVSDGRSDQWQIGAVLFEALTGRRLLPGSTLQEIGKALATGKYTPMDREALGVPAHVEHTLMRAVALDPDKRFPTLAAMAASLQDPDHPDRDLTEEISREFTLEGSSAELDVAAVAPRSAGASSTAAGGAAQAPAPASSPARRGLLAVGLLALLALAWSLRGAPAPVDVEWSVVGDVLLVRFRLGGEQPALEVAGERRGALEELDGGLRRIVVHDLPADREAMVRLVWDGGAGPLHPIQAKPPALDAAPDLAPRERLRFAIERPIQVRWEVPGAEEVAARPPYVDLPLPPGDPDRVRLVWEEEGLEFSRQVDPGALVTEAVDRLRRRLDAHDVRGAVAAMLEADEPRSYLAEPRKLWRPVLDWVPRLLTRDLDLDRARWLFDALQLWRWSVAVERTQPELAPEPLLTPAGRAGAVGFSLPTWSSPQARQLSMTAIDPGPEAERAHGIKIETTVDGFGRTPSLGNYASGLEVRWPDGVPPDGVLWVGVHPRRFASSNELVLRVADGSPSPLTLRLWHPSPGPLFAGGPHRDALGVYLPARLAPAAGTPVRVELDTLPEMTPQACTISLVEVRWP